MIYIKCVHNCISLLRWIKYFTVLPSKSLFRQQLHMTTTFKQRSDFINWCLGQQLQTLISRKSEVNVRYMREREMINVRWHFNCLSYLTNKHHKTMDSHLLQLKKKKNTVKLKAKFPHYALCSLWPLSGAVVQTVSGDYFGLNASHSWTVLSVWINHLLVDRFGKIHINSSLLGLR